MFGKRRAKPRQPALRLTYLGLDDDRHHSRIQSCLLPHFFWQGGDKADFTN